MVLLTFAAFDPFSQISVGLCLIYFVPCLVVLSDLSEAFDKCDPFRVTRNGTISLEDEFEDDTELRPKSWYARIVSKLIR